MTATNDTMPLTIDLSSVRDQLRVIAYDAAADAYKAVSKQKHAFAAYLDVKGMAAFLGCSTSYVYKLEALGLPVSIIDGHRVYSKEKAIKFIDSMEV